MSFARPSTLLRNLRAQANNAALSGGAAMIYDGTPPADADHAITDQVTLIILALPNPFGSVSGGTLSASAVAQVQAIASGEPTFARLVDSGGNALCDVSAGGPDSGAVIEVSPSPIFAGGTVDVDFLHLVEP